MEQRQLMERLITPTELAGILGLKRSVTYRMLRSGQIPSVRVTNSERKLSLRVRPSDLQRWLKMREVGK
jgi:excisionase family DNA binding protein